MSHIAVVVIGRNEAKKLGRCLSSVAGQGAQVIFVDSGSEDGSAALALSMGVEVVVLDRSTPFTVARARNAGLAQAIQLDRAVEYVQFVDADSELTPTWLARAADALTAHQDVAVVFGRVRERDPGLSVYARLYEIDFDLHFGQSNVCGGMGMMRVRALQDAGGFNTDMRGFEDFELSSRVRRAGWRVVRLNAEMALHETGMVTARHWWRRQIRTGYVRGQEVVLPATLAERSSARENLSIWFWALAVPSLSVALASITRGASLLLLIAYVVLFARIYRRHRSSLTAADSALYAATCVLGKFPQVLGLARFHLERLIRRTRREPVT
jgi:glycosyltransferase involved in cell wall biosynthesis